MNLPRRRVALAALALAAGPLPTATRADAWPAKPVRFTVPSPAGSAPDIMARVIGDKLSHLWGQTVIVENRPGAGGVIGFTALKTGGHDEHGFVFAPASALTLSPYMYRSRQVDIVADFVPVAMIGISPMMIAASADSPANSLAELIALARKPGGDFVVATTAQYTVPHLTADMLARAADAPLRAVPYGTSGQAIAAVVNGDAQMLIDGVPPIEPMVKGGRLKAIALFSERRVPDRPQLPTVAESYPSMVINGWFGMVTLEGTSTAAIDRVNRDVARVIAMPEVVATMAKMGVYPKPMSPAQFGGYLASERRRWEKALVDVGAQRAQ